MGQPKTVDFYRCLRPVQDRFVAAARQTAPPAPLLFWPARRTSAWLLLVAAAFLFVGATMVLLLGLGDPTSALALHGKPMLGVDIGLFAAASYCFVHATGILRGLEALPYRAGMYVFPACFVDAGGPVLRVWPVADADGVERLALPGLALRLAGGERVVVPAARTADVDRAEAALASLRPELTRALAEDDVDTLAELDPLHQTRVSSPISSTESMKRYSPMWLRFDWVLALAMGVTLGLGLGSVRNSASDERMYQALLAAPSVLAYQQYLIHGGRHTDEVQNVLLARAELYGAQKTGTLEALQEFVRTHPSQKIGTEVDAAFRRVMLVELEKAKAVGTVAALDDFAKSYPDNHLGPELQAARHALYAQALAAWKKKVQVDAATSAFMERLLASAEKAGASCEVRFRFKPSKTLEDADKRVAKHAYYPGTDALPSHYVTVDAMRPREQRVAQALVDGFAAAFPPDVLSLHAGEPLAPDAAVPTGAPILVLDYSIEWTTAMSANAKPRTIFAGMRVDFDGRFSLPEGAPLVLSHKSWRNPEIWKVHGAATLEEFMRKVYDLMIDRAFDEWQYKLNDALLR